MALFRRGKRPDPFQAGTMALKGVRRRQFRDVYHMILRARWGLVLLGIATVIVLVNLVFACIYDAVGGVGGMREGAFSEYFFFSVETLATIGYGNMYPVSIAAGMLVTCESIIGLFIVALTTGLIFSKFAALRARIQFAREAVIGPLDGIPTLMFRMGNERSSSIIDAVVRVVMFRTEVSIEGVKLYRMYDLPLDRERAPALARSWTVLHRIRPGALLYGATPETLVKDEIEFLVAITGLDELTGQSMHARTTYDGAKLTWGARHADMLTERPDGVIELDMNRFHEVLPTRPTADFPYPKQGEA
jgi:inward rectifier potassium channel